MGRQINITRDVYLLSPKKKTQCVTNIITASSSGPKNKDKKESANNDNLLLTGETASFANRLVS